MRVLATVALCLLLIGCDMSVRRLLAVAQGGGSFTAAPVLDWFGMYNGQDGDGVYAIGYADTTDGGETWTAHTAPVLQKGSGGAWDDAHVKDPALVWDGSQYVIFYSGYDGTNYRIGMATAPTLAAIRAGTITKDAGNPVIDIGAGGTFNDVHVFFPTPLYDGSRWHLWYGAYDGSKWRSGYAYSDDDRASWTDVGQVLDVGAGGQWDDEAALCVSVLKVGATYYLYYGGTSDPGGDMLWQTGVVTFTDPEGTYTRSASNPVAENRNTEEPDSSQVLTVTSGSTSATVEDSSLLNVGESIVLADNNSTVDVNEVSARPDATHVTLAQTALNTYAPANGARIRPLAYLSLQARSVVLQGSTYVMYATAFQPVADLTVSGGTLWEGSLRLTSSDPEGPFAYDYTAGLLIPLQGTGRWDEVSAENLSVAPS